jgi:glycosyltransferase involved in cell wall biosynthesis
MLNCGGLRQEPTMLKNGYKAISPSSSDSSPRPLRVGIDARVLTESAPMGVSRWTTALLRALAQLAPHYEYLLYVSKDPLRELPFTSLPFRQRLFTRNTLLTSPFVWQQFSLPWCAWRDRVDVLFSPYYSGPLFSLAPQIVALHDLSFVLFPHDAPSWVRFKPKLFARPSSRRAARVVTISEFSRQEILRVYQLPAPKVVVIPAGCEDDGWQRHRPVADLARVVPQQPFFLFVGSLLPRRQVALVVEALAQLASEYHFVLVGESDSARCAALVSLARQRQIVDRVHCVGHISDQVLDDLYHRALALISPSTYEGFGLPVLEAMRRGLPVIAWDIPVMREVAQEAIILLPVGDRASLVTAMRRVATEPALRQTLSQTGKERAAMFSWQRSARTFLSVLQEVAREASPRSHSRLRRQPLEKT